MSLESELDSLIKQKSHIEAKIAEIKIELLSVKNTPAYKKIEDVFTNPSEYDTTKIERFFRKHDSALNVAGFDYVSFYIQGNQIFVRKVANNNVKFPDYLTYSIEDLIVELKKLYENDNTEFNVFIDNNQYMKEEQTGGRKNAYKSTKKKVSVIFKKKSLVRTVYKNAKGDSYIKVNSQYKLLSKFKV